MGRERAVSDGSQASVSVQASMVGGVVELTGGDAEDVRLAGEAALDPRAFERIYRRHYRMVAAYLYRRTGDVHAAEDLAAETFLAAMKSAGRMYARGVPPRLWLLGVATRAASSWNRGLARRQRREQAAAALSAARRSEGWNEELEVVRLAMEGLADRFRAVLSLHLLAGLSVQEVSVALGVREGTVKSRLARGREMLRRRVVESAGPGGGES